MQIAKELQKKYKKVKIIKIPRKQKMPHDGYRVFNNVKIKNYSQVLILQSYLKAWMI